MSAPTGWVGRRPNWGIELRRWARAVEGQPFQWGVTDCASLVRGALLVMFGVDVLPGRYWATAAQAARVAAETGGIRGVLQDLGAVEAGGVQWRKTGDILVYSQEEEVGREAAGVCVDVRDCLLTSHIEGVRRTVPDNGVVFAVTVVPLGGWSRG